MAASLGGGADSILDTRHNLSVNAPTRTPTARVWTDVARDSDIRSAGINAEERVCIFCHTPHHSNSVTPLWSRDTGSTVYRLYQSDTVSKGLVQQPFGSSRLCLSCHDGTIAMNMRFGETSPFTSLAESSGNPVYNMPGGDTNLGIDLGNDHPISLSYPDASEVNGEIKDAALLPPDIRLEEGRYLQCTSCHDPHKDPYGNFLVMDNNNGASLCTSCHNKSGWSETSHNAANGGTIPSKGCENCHRPHGAPGTLYLRKFAIEEDNCYAACHNGTGPGANVKSITSQYGHPSVAAVGVHRSGEDSADSSYHVECTDCHNPHHANGATASPPSVSGALEGVKVKKLGGGLFQIASTEYEICFKCHGAANATYQSTTQPPPPPRLIDEQDQTLRFDPQNPSFHPVTADRTGNGRSLRAEFQTTMRRIYCTDCHNSDKGSKAGYPGQPDGPHGSSYPHILIAQYIQDGNPTYSSANYALCFRCHDETYLLSDASAFPSHKSHLKGKETHCSACHDPHGVPQSRGATAAANSHLVNFDIRYTGPDAAYDAAARSCSVSCHNKNPRFY